MKRFKVQLSLQKVPLKKAAIQKLVLSILSTEKLARFFEEDAQVEISIVIARDPLLHHLNKEYRNKDKPTDVLSFSAEEGESISIPHRVLGDLVISYDRVLIQAKKYKHSPQRELTRLLVHGVLHLLGFDHERVSAATAAKMRRLERTIMKAI